MFKVGERVWHIMCGWGVLEENLNRDYPLSFRSDSGILLGGFTADGKHHPTNINPVIFYKEQTFDMSKPEPEIGTWGYFWDKDDEDYCVFAMLLEINMEIRLKYFVSRKTRYECYSTDIPPHIKELMNGNNKPNP